MGSRQINSDLPCFSPLIPFFLLIKHVVGVCIEEASISDYVPSLIADICLMTNQGFSAQNYTASAATYLEIFFYSDYALLRFYFLYRPQTSINLKRK